MTELQTRRVVGVLCACALALMLTDHWLSAGIIVAPPLVVVLILDQRRHSREARTATARLRARAPELTQEERQAELDAITARYGGQWTRDVRSAANELGVSVEKVGPTFVPRDARHERRFLRALALFAGGLVLVTVVAAVLGW